MIKYLRIAVTALNLTACVLLVALWVRTKFAQDSISGPIWGGRTLVIGSLNGAIGIRLVHERSGDAYPWSRLSRLPKAHVPLPFTTYLGFGGVVQHPESILWVRVPYWFLILVNGLVVAIQVQGFPIRFNLRTLLIATTLVAVALGVIVAVN